MVLSEVDKPDDPFRVKLVCLLVETSSRTLLRHRNAKNLRQFLVLFSRYVHCKSVLSIETRFHLEDMMKSVAKDPIKYTHPKDLQEAQAAAKVVEARLYEADCQRLEKLHGIHSPTTNGSLAAIAEDEDEEVEEDDDDRSQSGDDDDSNDDDEDDDDEDGESKGLLVSMLTLDLENVFVRNGINTGNAWAMLLVAMTIIGSACFLLVHSCEMLGDALGIPIYFIAVILASAATSVPDTILSMKDAQKGNYDDAVSNALGSNIFDVCFALGFPLFIFTLIYGPITMSPETVINIAELRILLLILTLFAFFIYIGGKSMGRLSAFLLLLIYFVFTMYILGRAVDSSAANEVSIWLRNINDIIDSLRFWK